MAYMKLTILGAGGVDADDNELEDLSMTTGSDALVGRCKMSAVYWTKSTDGQWSDRQNPGLLTFQLSLQYVEFRKQMYSPNSIEAYLLIKPIDIGTIKYKAFPSKEQLNKLFANRLVENLQPGQDDDPGKILPHVDGKTPWGGDPVRRDREFLDYKEQYRDEAET